MKKIGMLFLSFGLVPILGALDFDSVKKLTVQQLHDYEMDAYLAGGESQMWNNCTEAGRRYLNEAIDKCHTKSEDDNKVAENLKEVINSLYDYKIEVVVVDGEKGFDEEKRGVYPFRSTISHLAWTMMNGADVAGKIDEFLSVAMMIDKSKDDQDIKFFVSQNLLDSFVEVCHKVAVGGGFDKEVKPVPLGQFKDKFVQAPAVQADGSFQDNHRKKLEEIHEASKVEPAKKSWMWSILKWGTVIGGGFFVGKFGLKVWNRYKELKAANEQKDEAERDDAPKLLAIAIKEAWNNGDVGVLDFIWDKFKGALGWLGYGEKTKDELQKEVDAIASSSSVANNSSVVNNGHVENNGLGVSDGLGGIIPDFALADGTQDNASSQNNLPVFDGEEKKDTVIPEPEDHNGGTHGAKDELPVIESNVKLPVMVSNVSDKQDKETMASSTSSNVGNVQRVNDTNKKKEGWFSRLCNWGGRVFGKAVRKAGIGAWEGLKDAPESN